MEPKRVIETPLTDAVIKTLRAGEMIYISGEIYTARDAAHRRIAEMLRRGDHPPFEFAGNIVYYAGPCPAPPGAVIGSIGPTTSGRMDDYSPFLIERGLKGMIGKGARGGTVMDAIQKHGGVYFAAIGGAAAYMAGNVAAAEVIAFEDLGTEAIRRLTVRELPVIVAADMYGGDIYARQ